MLRHHRATITPSLLIPPLLVPTHLRHHHAPFSCPCPCPGSCSCPWPLPCPYLLAIQARNLEGVLADLDDHTEGSDSDSDSDSDTQSSHSGSSDAGSGGGGGGGGHGQVAGTAASSGPGAGVLCVRCERTLADVIRDDADLVRNAQRAARVPCRTFRRLLGTPPDGLDPTNATGRSVGWVRMCMRAILTAKIEEHALGQLFK